VLKSATSWAVVAGLLGRDPLVGFKRRRAQSKPMTSWSVPEARSFLAATREDRLAWAWALLLTRGLRHWLIPTFGESRFALTPGCS
jgi:hypothetical protein